MPPVLQHSRSGRILLLDDNDLGLVARKSVLAELGHEIVTSKAPVEALALCLQQRFDLVVTDFKMPVMDGIEFIRRLREQSPGVPVILLSGFSDALGLSEANTGADAVIQKSATEVPHLIRSVNRLLRKPAAKKPAGSQTSTRGKKAKGVAAGHD